MNSIRKILESEKFEYFNIAVLFHLTLVLILSLIVNRIQVNDPILYITSSLVDDTIIQEIETELPLENFDNAETAVSNEIIDGSESSSNTNVEISIPSVNQIDIDTTNIEDSFSSNFIGETVSGVSDKIGNGLSTECSTGGALDRLTVEIIDHAQTRDLNVIWLLDASISLSFQRTEIQNRFDRIIQEVSFAESSHSINHGICSFGKSINFISTDLSDNAEILKNDINKIILDESGIENVFGAVGEVCKKYSKYGSRLMIIVFTDEIGDDIQLLDSVSQFCTRKGCSIYVVGSPAPFGKSKAQFKFVDFDPSYDQKEKWVEIQQGPETLYPMVLDMKSLPIDNETLDSGFGSFALSKLCMDTGGIYFSVHPDRSSTKIDKQKTSPLSSYISRFFDHKVMVKYKPDYRSYGLQSKEAQSNLAKKALVQSSLIPLNISGEQTLRFKAFDEGMFVNELNMAQRFSARLEPKINQIYQTLSTGEPSYASLDDRWKVSYALSMGRILATKCRIESYNQLLAEAKTGLKKNDPKSNIWLLLPSKDFTINSSTLKKIYEGSQKYLKFVVDNYPDTPWALIANEELNTPLSYKWYENYEEPPKINNGNGGNNTPKDDLARPKLIPKPQRKIDKI